MEILAKKFDRFGWDRDSGTAAQDGMIRDWMDALQDYPLDEVRAACRRAVIENPNKMPNEGHVVRQILKSRNAKGLGGLQYWAGIVNGTCDIPRYMRPSEKTLRDLLEAGLVTVEKIRERGLA